MGNRRKKKKSQRFRGRHQRSLDHKGRLAIPAPFRRVLKAISSSEVVLTRGHDHTIEIYPLARWEEFEDSELLSLPYEKLQARRFRRHFTFDIKEDSVDRQGRVLIPDFLLEYAGITKDVIITGEIDHIALWSPEGYERFMTLIQEYFARDSEEVDSIRRKDESKRKK